MLKCRRLVLQPPNESLYGNLRKEPRRESVSTIEAAAHTLAALEGDDSIVEKILPPFKLLLKKARR
jgi:DTW domain-containing protein YfiP